MTPAEIQSLIKKEIASATKQFSTLADSFPSLIKRFETLEQHVRKNSESTIKSTAALNSFVSVVEANDKALKSLTDEETRGKEKKELVRYLDHKIIQTVENVLTSNQYKKQSGSPIEQGIDAKLVQQKINELTLGDEVSHLKIELNRIETELKMSLEDLKATIAALQNTNDELRIQVKKHEIGLGLKRQLSNGGFTDRNEPTITKASFDVFLQKWNENLVRLNREIGELKTGWQQNKGNNGSRSELRLQTSDICFDKKIERDKTIDALKQESSRILAKKLREMKRKGQSLLEQKPDLKKQTRPNSVKQKKVKI